MQGDGAAWLMERVRNGGWGQQGARTLVPGCEDRVRFQLSREAENALEVMPWSPCSGSSGSRHPGTFQKEHHVTAAEWSAQVPPAGAWGEQGGPRCGEAEEEPEAGAKPIHNREGPFPGARGCLGGSCCHRGRQRKCLNREQDGSKLSCPLFSAMQPQHLWGSVILSPPAQLCFLKVCCSTLFKLLGFSLKHSFGV